jgi:transcriptional regulator with XRE-family HTH domain
MGGGQQEPTGFTKWLQSRNKSLSEAALSCGVSRRTLIKVAKGQFPMLSPPTLQLLADYVGCSVKTVERQLQISASDWQTASNEKFSPSMAKLMVIERLIAQKTNELSALKTEQARLQEIAS